MKVFVIILTFGDISVTKECVASFCEIDVSFTKIIVVNNNPQNITSAVFGSYRNDVEVINNHKNLGFAGGVNRGIKKAVEQGAEYILLLNNDTILKQPILEGMIAFGEKTKKAGVIAPAISFEKGGKTWFDVGGNVNLLFGRTHHTEVHKITATAPRRVAYVSGCCMLLKAEVIESVGLLDENFFLYYEDVDYCLRVHEKGYYAYVLPSIVIQHALSKTIGKVSPLALYHQTRSALVFGRKYCQKTYLFHSGFVLMQTLLFTSKDAKNSWYAWKAMVAYWLRNSKENV